MPESHADQPIMDHDQSVAIKLQRLVGSEAYKHQRERMIGLLGNIGSESVICDVGCGEGVLCRDLEASSPASVIVGIDSSQFVLDLARNQASRNSTVSYIRADAGRLPFTNESLDVLIFANTLKYLGTEEAQRRTLDEHMRVLRPGGTLLVVDGNDAEISYTGGDQGLNDRMVSAYAELQGDPYSGGKIETLCRSIGLQGLRSDVIVLSEDSFDESMAGFAMAHNMSAVLASAAPNDAAEFVSQLAASHNRGEYAWQYVKYATAGTKPIVQISEQF